MLDILTECRSWTYELNVDLGHFTLDILTNADLGQFN